MPCIKPSQLRSARVYLELTQVALAKALNVSKPTIGNWEREGRNIPIYCQEKIIDFFETKKIFFTEDGFVHKNSSISVFSHYGLEKFFNILHNYISQNNETYIDIIGVDVNDFFGMFELNVTKFVKLKEIQSKLRKHPFLSNDIQQNQLSNKMCIMFLDDRLALVLTDPIEIIIIDRDLYIKDIKSLLHLK